jgi:small subunit ribosomal protein S3
MGQKVHPKAFRLGGINTWSSRWYGSSRNRSYQRQLRADVEVRGWLTKELKEAAVDHVDIERSPSSVSVVIHTAKPGFIIGRAGAGADELKKKLIAKFFSDKQSKTATGAKAKTNVKLNIVEISRPALSAAIVLQGMAADIEKRMPFRRVLKMAIERVMKAGALGVKLMVSGRLNGAEIARREMLSSGSVPLQNLRADIDYAQGFAQTIFGAIGIKVWIYRGEVFDREREKRREDAAAATAKAASKAEEDVAAQTSNKLPIC